MIYTTKQTDTNIGTRQWTELVCVCVCERVSNRMSILSLQIGIIRNRCLAAKAYAYAMCRDVCTIKRNVFSECLILRA